MQVRELMSSPAVTIPAEATLHEGIERMLEHRIGSVIVDDDGPVGIMTRSDVLRAAYHAGGSLEELQVTRAMSSPLITTQPTRTLTHSLQKMADHNVKKLPVVEDLEIIGIVTLTDIAHRLPAEVREAQSSMDRKDDWTS